MNSCICNYVLFKVYQWNAYICLFKEWKYVLYVNCRKVYFSFHYLFIFYIYAHPYTFSYICICYEHIETCHLFVSRTQLFIYCIKSRYPWFVFKRRIGLVNFLYRRSVCKCHVTPQNTQEKLLIMPTVWTIPRK